MPSIATRVNAKQQQQRVNHGLILGILFTFVISEEPPHGFQELLTSVVAQYRTQLS